LPCTNVLKVTNNYLSYNRLNRELLIYCCTWIEFTTIYYKVLLHCQLHLILIHMNGHNIKNLTLEGQRMFSKWFCQKLTFFGALTKIENNFFFNSNCTKAQKTIRKMCRNFFTPFDYVNCKIRMFEVWKKNYFHPAKQQLVHFELS